MCAQGIKNLDTYLVLNRVIFAVKCIRHRFFGFCYGVIFNLIRGRSKEFSQFFNFFFDFFSKFSQLFFSIFFLFFFYFFSIFENSNFPKNDRKILDKITKLEILAVRRIWRSPRRTFRCIQMAQVQIIFHR